MTQINIKEGAAFGYGVLFEYWKPIASLIMQMLPVLFAVSMLQHYFTNPNISAIASNTLISMPISFLLSIVGIWLFVPFQVSIYRLILCKEPIDMNYYQRLFYPREVAYFQKSIVYTLILIGVVLLFGIAAVIPLVVANILGSWLFMGLVGFAVLFCFIAFLIIIALRLLLVFPAISVDEDLTFLGSYKMLKVHTWRFFLCAAIACLPFLGLTLLTAPLLLSMPQSLISLSAIVIVQTGLGLLLSVPIYAVVAYVFQKIQ